MSYDGAVIVVMNVKMRSGTNGVAGRDEGDGKGWERGDRGLCLLYTCAE
jgi:hypothetical protein